MMPLENLRLGLLQTALDWEDAKANVARIDQHIEALSSPVDLIVLPEMWATGFTMRPKDYGMPWSNNQPVPHDAWPAPLRAMLRWAQCQNAAVVGSLACRLEGHAAAVNRCFFITPEGQITQYDKRHTFTFAGEDQHYQAGRNRVEVQWRGWRILLQICYDLRFPVFSRNQLQQPYDLAVYVANWPAVRSAAWSALLPARAIENQAYVAGVNRVGRDGNGIEHLGGTALFDPFGARLANAQPNESQWVIANCDAVALQTYREKFPVLKDADYFELKG